MLTALPFMAIGALLLLTTGRALDALTLGENGAKSLGVDLFRLQWLIVLGVGLSVGASVAVSGVVGFVGLFGDGTDASHPHVGGGVWSGSGD